MTSAALSPVPPPGEPAGDLAALSSRTDRVRHPRFRRVCQGVEPPGAGEQVRRVAPASGPAHSPPGDQPVPQPRPAPAAPSIPEQRAHPVTTARRRAESVLRMALEVMEGRRPVAHLAPFVTPGVVRYVAAAAESPYWHGPRTAIRPAPRPRPGAPALRSLRVVLPGPDAAEITAVCRFRGRVRAVAGRMRLGADREWRCVALRML